jgi:hypothetical protein
MHMRVVDWAAERMGGVSWPGVIPSKMLASTPQRQVLRKRSMGLERLVFQYGGSMHV